jgi:hypothetical protein
MVSFITKPPCAVWAAEIAAPITRWAEPEKKVAAATNTLASALLPESVIQEIEQGDENVMSTFSRLIVKNSFAAMIAIQKRNYVAFDCSAADAGCELRALKFCHFFQAEEVLAEAEKLRKNLIAINTLLEKRRNPPKRQKAELCIETTSFYKQNIANIVISEKMLFLVQAHLLATATNKNYKVDPLMFKGYAKGIEHPKFEKSRNVVIGELRSRISRLSMALFRIESAKIKTGSKEELALIQEMLSPRASKELREKEDGERIYAISPITIGCSFYKIKALMLRIREEQILLAVKITASAKDGQKSFLIFYRSKEPGGSLIQVCEEEVKALNKGKPIIILEGKADAKFDRDLLAKKFNEMDVSEVILAAVTSQPSYGKSSDINDKLILPNAQKEILTYMVKAKEMGCEKGMNPFFDPDHFFCSTLEREILEISQGR